MRLTPDIRGDYQKPDIPLRAARICVNIEKCNEKKKLLLRSFFF